MLKKNQKKRIISGITATGELTIGNYIGVIKPLIKLQKQNYELLIFVADLHALTNEIKPQILKENKKKIFTIFLACGLNSKNTTLFFQSDIKEHAQINWILENHTTIGELSRMNQFKQKSLNNKKENKTIQIKTGLLTYPVLMAGDILLYKPDIVPVGEDQKQHLELTKNIAKRFNNYYKIKFFKIPIFYTPKIGSKIKNLKNPLEKMSKSSKDKNTIISLFDNPEIAYKKIQKSKTDSENKIYASESKPGITNLINIYASLKNLEINEVEKYFKNENYGFFKKKLGLLIKDFLINLQIKYNKYYKKIDKIAKKGAKKASKIAKYNLLQIEQIIGLK